MVEDWSINSRAKIGEGYLPEMWDPGEAFSDISGQVEAELVEEQDEGLGLEPHLLLLVPRYHRNRLLQI